MVRAFGVFKLRAVNAAERLENVPDVAFLAAAGGLPFQAGSEWNVLTIRQAGVKGIVPCTSRIAKTRGELV